MFGSGKTLTSFKASQILMKLPNVKKVVFVVDRRDLDYQTTKEFNSFSNGSVDGTVDTKSLVKQFCDDTKLIVTTIQKLNTAISKKQYLSKMQKIQDEHIVFIFDECHRSQFGDTHKNISTFFTKNQMIGFTGTPIFVENAIGKRTTADLFSSPPLHKYVITDAINDENVLKFSIEYVGRYKEKETVNNIDIEVEDIDTKELLESEKRAEKIVDYILANHDRKTHSREFTAMMTVSSVDMLIKYYEIFKSKKHKLKIATIFSYGANEDDKEAQGIINNDGSDESLEEESTSKHSREKLDEYIIDYNNMFGSKYSTKSSQDYYNYYNDISQRVKNKEIDILLVVNMFLTGFDSKPLNTIYVDKNLKHHGLIQAFSRTNRILNEKKSQGNIICFRNLKSATDDAIRLFSNINAKDTIIMQPYEEYVIKFNEAFIELITITPSVSSVDTLLGEELKLEFIKAFRKLLRIKNILEGFSDFKWSHLSMSEQMFEDYKSKYLDMYQKIKDEKGEGSEKVSILEDVDFELELIHKDEINVSYIIRLLAQFKNAKEEDKKEQKENIENLLNGNASLRSKRELIEKFINENLMKNSDKNIEEEFEKFWDKEKVQALDNLCEEENLDKTNLKKVIDTYIYDERKPLANDVTKTLKVKPKLLERKKIIPRVLNKIISFVQKFYDDMGTAQNISNNSAYEIENKDENILVAEEQVEYN